MNKLLTIITLTVLFQASAHAENMPDFLDCNEATENAVTKISHPTVSKWAQIVCTKYGHMIVPQNGYLWSYYGGFAPIAFYAQGEGKEGKLLEVGHKAYFTDVTIQEFDESKSKEIAIKASFNKTIEDEIPKVFGIRAYTNDGGRFTFFIQKFTSRIRGAIICPKFAKCEGKDDLMSFFIHKRNEE